MNLQTETYKSFEIDKLNLFEVEPILTNDNFDPDSNFLNEKVNSFEPTYYMHEQFVYFPSNLSENFSIIDLNIGNLHKNMDKLQDFLNDIKGATKLYFMYCYRVVIIFFSSRLYKSVFSTYSLVKLVFRFCFSFCFCILAFRVSVFLAFNF